MSPAPTAGFGPDVALVVLVVEDNFVNQQLARAQLRTAGPDRVVAGSREDRLAHLASPAGADVDVVLIDHHLPGIDGLETG